MNTTIERVLAPNAGPADDERAAHLTEGFLDFFLPLHREFTPWQQRLNKAREAALADSHAGRSPDHLPPSEAGETRWEIVLPGWCEDQRNQMTGPADDADLVVKMLNSGAPGVMLDLEDSMANSWPNLLRGIKNVLAALNGSLGYFDRKRNTEVGIRESRTVIWTRPRGLHLNQAGVVKDELTSASLFDVASIVYEVEAERLRHPLAFYIPKSESAEEALWWRELFQTLAVWKGWPRDYIKCMALVESHPLAFQMEEFLYNLREHIVGLNLGRWDYMASLIHFNLENPAWVLPDRNTIPHDVAFFQRLRELLVEVCHRHGALAIGGMTALYPSRTDAELNERALLVLAADKKNEAGCLMDGAWTGHPDQNEIAVTQFPAPNQIKARRVGIDARPNLRPVPDGVGARTLYGTRAAVRTVIRYRHGVLNGKGASLLDGYMEDLATDRIYRLMIAQRMRHSRQVIITNEDNEAVEHTAEFIHGLFDEELARLQDEHSATDGAADTLREAREQSERMILGDEFDPV